MKEHYVLAIDVAKGKSMVSLISSCGEVLISPYEINHNLNNFKNLDERIKKLNVFNDTAVIKACKLDNFIFFLDISSPPYTALL